MTKPSFKDPVWRAEQEQKANKMGNTSVPDVYMRYAWCLDEHEGKQLILTKARLGDFVFRVLMLGGDVTQLWAFAVSERARVFPSVRLTCDARDELESGAGYKLRAHPVVKLN